MLLQSLSEARLNDNQLEEAVFENESVPGTDFSKLTLDSVKFNKCVLADSNFSRANFHNVVFSDCDLSNCIFLDSYWKKTRLVGCKGDQSDFSVSLFKEFTLHGGSWCYSNWHQSTWEKCGIFGGVFKQASFSEVSFKKMEFKQADLSSVDFFKTLLQGIDISDSLIDGISVSDDFNELRGVKINEMQAIILAKIVGAEIV